MIYVIETDGQPMCPHRTSRIYAYVNLDAAKRAARPLGGRVVTYSAGDVRDEDLARVAEERLAELNALRAEQEAEQHGLFALRQSFGARENETMQAWIARLYSGYRRWHRLLDDVQRAIEAEAADPASDLATRRGHHG